MFYALGNCYKHILRSKGTFNCLVLAMQAYVYILSVYKSTVTFREQEGKGAGVF